MHFLHTITSIVLNWFCFIHLTNATHITGTFQTDDYFNFLVKFGSQKTEVNAKKDTGVYIFGNITSNHPIANCCTLVVLDRDYFLYYYANRTLKNKAISCKLMFHELNAVTFDHKCNKNGTHDYLRRVPCPNGQLCPDEDEASNVVNKHQFTYLVGDFDEPRFWFVSLVACYRNETTCEWEHYNGSGLSINYDIWLVNGNPNQSTTMNGMLNYQFSFERMNTLEMYLGFWLCYIIVVPLQIYAARLQRHPVTKLFTASLVLDFIALNFIVLHTLVFSMNGEGFPRLAIAGDVLDILSRTTFMLLLLLLAKGWAVTRIELTRKQFVLFIWLCYGIVHILLYVWNSTEVDIIEDIDEYQTWPGWIILIFRSLIMIWLLLELRNTMMYEHNQQKLQFFLHFGASSLVWFIYLPIIAIIALQISPLWRYKLLVGMTYSADCLAYCVMTHLLWPTRSEQYFLLAERSLAEIEELDQFNEAPHVINSSQPDRQFNSLDSISTNDNAKLIDKLLS